MEQFCKFRYLISEERKNKKFEEVLSRVKEKNEAYEEDFCDVLAKRLALKHPHSWI